ncbi:MAG: GUN4 domain-containing protein [Crocosphaera sp.]
MVDSPKRLQVFVSSTYIDLIEERQAAVQAILEAKHIPAGMELFTAGDQSQWEVIKHWIDQSDVYLLILGGRYGSIDKETGKSYTHLEYEYALEREIPLFSCVLRDPDKRAMEKGDINKYLERDNPAQYKEFKNLVTSKLVRFWENSEQIKTSIILTLNEFEKRSNLIGWVRSDKQVNSNLIEQEQEKLNQKIKELEQLLERERNTYSQQLTETASTINQLQAKIHCTKLRDLLAAGEWFQADKETANIMLQTANRVKRGSLSVEDIENFPCDELRTIDQLWVHYSKGKFGFSVQRKIYIDEIGGTRDYDYTNNSEIISEFRRVVGWDWQSCVHMMLNNIKSLDDAPMGYYPVGAAVTVQSTRISWGYSDWEFIDFRKIISQMYRTLDCNI